ncbi:hypothetical protein L195_g027897, partial [Trifolium pratense]
MIQRRNTTANGGDTEKKHDGDAKHGGAREKDARLRSGE